MDIEITSRLCGEKLNSRNALLSRCNLKPDTAVEKTVLVWEDKKLIATGSRQGNILKCIAVDDAHQGDGLTATVVTALRRDAFDNGHRRLFLYTKPQNAVMFSSLFFYPIAQTPDVLLMEDQKNGIRNFLNDYPPPHIAKNVGAVVMNCDPFTLGHQYLIETAAKQCEHLYVFVLSEDKGRFSATDRLEMVKRGTAKLTNVTVLPTGPYLISAATFPTYFLKEKQSGSEVQCRLDIAVFSKHYIPHFGITKRFVGEEPFCAVTRQYNAALKALLPIEVVEIPRLEKGGIPVSASAVRQWLSDGNLKEAIALVPQTTAEFF